MLISIITINYNNLGGLRETLESVKQQTFNDYEHILIDGNSTDGSGSLVRQHISNGGKGVTEPDKGVYDAQNKGVLRAEGDYILFLNSGDCLARGDSLFHLAQPAGAADFIYGDIIYKKHDDLNHFRFPSTPDMQFMLEKGLPHPTTLIRRSLFQQIGLYNTESKIVADWEFFMLALFKHNATAVHVSHPITVFDCTGLSSAEKNVSLTVEEQTKFLKKYFPQWLEQYYAHGYYVKRQRNLASQPGLLRRLINKLIS